MKSLFLIIFLTAPSVLCSPTGLTSLLASPKFDPVNDRPFLADLITRAYGGNIRHGFKIIDLIESYPYDEQRIVGYRLLFDEMLENNDLYSVELMTLANRVQQLNEKFSTNADIKFISEKLPKSVLNFPWKKEFRIKNKMYNEFIYSPYDGQIVDAQRRNIYSWKDVNNCNDDSCKWMLQQSKNKISGFHIINKLRNEMLFATNNFVSEAKSFRYVYGWREKIFRPYGGELWMFEPIDGSDAFKIYNMYYGEYMYSQKDRLDKDSDRRRVQTWRKGACDYASCEFLILS